jgi:hypothetical protein
MRLVEYPVDFKMLAGKLRVNTDTTTGKAMKKHFLIICGILALAMASNLSAQTQDGTAKVVSLKGAARTMPDGRPVKVGQILKSGAIVQTAADSYVDLVLNNNKATQGLGSALTDEPASASTSTAVSGGGSGYKPKAVQDAIRIFENSVMSLDKLTVTKTGADVVTDTQLDLKAGRIFGTVRKLSEASNYEIKVPNGVAGIRGTIFLVGADGVVNVLTGSVVISFVSGGAVNTKEVPAGFKFNPATGQVSKIEDPLMKWLQQIAQKFSKYLPNSAPTTVTGDHTVYNVSPTK